MALAVSACGSKDTGQAQEPGDVEIVAFVARPDRVEAGGSVEVSWETTNADRLSLTANGGDVQLGAAAIQAGSVSVVVDVETTFELTATGKKDGDVKTATATVKILGDAIEILSFTANPTEVEEGKETTLSWKTHGAEAIRIVDGALNEVDLGGQAAPEGSVKVAVASSTTFKLVASKGEEKAEATVTVKVKGSPVANLSADPARIVHGSTSTLTWQTEDAVSVAIVDEEDRPVFESSTQLSGTFEVTPSFTTTYRLTAIGATKQAVASAFVEVAPKIVSFAPVDPSAAGVGSLKALTWVVGGAREVEVSNLAGVAQTFTGDEAAQGSVSLPMSADGKFKLVARSGTLEASSELTIDIMLEPVIGSFEAARPVLTIGDDGQATAVLSWSGVERAIGLRLVGENLGEIAIGGDALVSGSVEVVLQADETFTLMASNESGDVAATAAVRLVPAAAIESLAALPGRVGVGEAFTVSWATTGATSIQLRQDGAVVATADDAVAAGAVELVAATNSAIELRAFNDAGDFVSRTLTVTVGAPTNTSFTATPNRVWVGGTATLAWQNLGGTSLSLKRSGEEIFATTDLTRIADGSYLATIETAGSSTFTLEVVNGASQRTTASIVVDAGTGPRIAAFSVGPAQLLVDTNATISWQTTDDPDGATPVLSLTDDRGGTYPIAAGSEHAGSLQRALGQVGSYTFTLTASTPSAGSTPVSETRSVTVVGVPAATLVATPQVFDTTVAPTVTLSWTSANAESLLLYQLDGSGAPVTPALLTVPRSDRASGSFQVVPARATTYRIVATNALGTSVSADASVTIAPPEILSFTATPVEVLVGDGVTLEWTTKMASGVSLSVLPGGLVFSETSAPYIDVQAAGGTKHDLTQTWSTLTTNDEGFDILTFPGTFRFPFGGQTYNRIMIYANGIASFDFGRTGTISSFSNTNFPSGTTSPWAHIAPFWDDLFFPNSATNGNVYYLLSSDAEGEFLAIQWKGITNAAAGTDNLNFEILLRPDGTFEYRYGPWIRGGASQGWVDGNSATIGYQFPDQSGYHVFSKDTAVPGGLGGRSFRYSPPPSLSPNDSYVWTPAGAGSKTVTLTARGEGTATATVDVIVHPRATLSVTAPSGEVLRDTNFTLSWTSTNATSVEVVDSSGTVRCSAASSQIASGSCVLSEATVGEHQYTVRAAGALESVVERVVRIIVYPPFELVDFTVSGTQLEYGAVVTLAWETSGATSITLSANGVELDLTGKDIDGDSLIHVPQRPTTYVLAIEAADGRIRTATKTVTVRTLDLSVDPVAADVSPGTPVTLSWTATSLSGGTARVYAPSPMEDVTSSTAFEDISSMPGVATLIAGGLDTTTVTVDFGGRFSFPFFGQRRTAARVSTDGVISFDTASTAFFTSNQPIPNDGTSNRLAHLAAFWDDLHTRTSGRVHSLRIDDDTYVVQWTHLSPFAGSSNTNQYDLNFQVVLHSDGTFEYRYGTMAAPASTSSSCFPSTCVNEANGSSATIGYQDPTGLMGHQLHFGGTSGAAGNPTFPGGIANRAFRYQPAAGVGTTTIVPAKTGDYTICAEVDGYMSCQTVHVTADFEISSFVTSAANVNRGQSVDLSWTTKGGDELTIKANGTVIADGTTVGISAGVLPLVPTETTTYVLELKNRFLNRTVTSSKTVTVKQFGLSVGASEASVNPGGAVTISWNADMYSGGNYALTTPMTEVASAFVDLSADSALQPIIGAGADSTMANVPFVGGFTFNYLGTPYSAVRVSTDGFLTFDSSATTTSSNSTLPSSSNKKVHLAAFWKDLHTRTNGRVYALATATEVIVQWSHISMFSGSSAAEHDLNFQVVLHADGSFEYRYGTMAGLAAPNVSTSCFPNTCENEANASSATIGYQDPTGVAGYLHYMGGTSNSASNFPFAGGLSNRSFQFSPFNGSGSVVVNPADTTSYRICAISGAFIECTDVITVQSEWKIVSFGASTALVEPGQPVTLSWETTGGDDIRLSATTGAATRQFDVSGLSMSSDTYTDNLPGHTTYNFELWSMGRVKRATKSVVARNVSVGLQASPTTVGAGQPVTLSWDAASNTGDAPALTGNFLVSEVSSPYEDITTSGGTLLSELGLGVLTTSGPYAIVDFSANGFTFPYFGGRFTRLKVGNQGVLSFDETLSGSRSSNLQLPTTDTNGVKVQFAPFWGDVQTAAAGSTAHPDGGVYAKFVSEPGGIDHYIIQYHHHRIGSAADGATDLNFQVVYFADGAVEYRYGDMLPLTGNNSVLGGSKTIGFQRPGGGWGHNIHFGSSSTTTFAGGFGHRSFRFEPLESTGSRLVTPTKTTTYNLCATVSGYTECKEVTIFVHDVGSVVITELMIDPAGGSTAQWFEIQNLNSIPIDLDRWVIETSSGSHVIQGPVVIPAFGFATLAASPSVGFTPSYVYGNGVALAVGGDTLRVKAFGFATVASVTWDSSWSIPSGSSLGLDGSYLVRGVLNNNPAQWCTGPATPGTAAVGCRFTDYSLNRYATVPFIDIRATGTTVSAMRDDSGKTGLTLPFSMPIFGSSTSQIWVDANGWVSFAPTQPSTSHFAPDALPRTSTATPAGPLFAAFYDDLGCTQSVGTWDWQYEHRVIGSNQVTILQWNNFNRCSNTGGTTFQIQLSSNGDMAVVFGNIVAAAGTSAWNIYNGSSAWIGLEGPDRTRPITALYKTVEPLSGRAFQFTKK
ncbi:Outer membrane protein A precursor [Vulgatibacter incomptus]|uniref:Outer membrane protein A n=2 Tax=Vulgatibacter incomptus TaxID=1391653 RepID=A0A0K1PBG0_9BACT|nr:Outer membrane protein A precursor [Vulgatibacter incomptus]